MKTSGIRIVEVPHYQLAVFTALGRRIPGVRLEEVDVYAEHWGRFSVNKTVFGPVVLRFRGVEAKIRGYEGVEEVETLEDERLKPSERIVNGLVDYVVEHYEIRK